MLLDKTSINWYAITKDIIIPSLGIISTIILGTIIAYFLKTKEEKGKIKSLLIDSYMAYLELRSNFFNYELTLFKYKVFKEIYLNNYSYLKYNSNDQMAKELIALKRDSLKLKLENASVKDFNWSPYTYKFAFLLGKEKYDKHIQFLEDNILLNYVSESARLNFLNQLKSKIESDKTILEKINTPNKNKIVDGIDNIEEIIENLYTKFQYKNFNPFDTKIANLIDKY